MASPPHVAEPTEDALRAAIASGSYETWLNLDITTLPPEARQ